MTSGTPIISIFLLIGFAHWAAHLLQCPGCKETLGRNILMALEGVIHIFGWPITLGEYVARALTEFTILGRAGIGKADVEKMLRQSIEQATARNLGKSNYILGVAQEDFTKGDAVHLDLTTMKLTKIREKNSNE